jgi:hypothetical protein
MRDPSTTLDPSVAAGLISDWGFLVEPDLPHRPGPACLLVAIRKQPTLRHYDPESVEYWVEEDGRGVAAILDHLTRMPLDVSFSWGQVRVVDRVRATNQYVTFGGVLTADRVDGTTVATFLSPAPLLRRGGHSQGWDPGASSLGAFFARLRAAVGTERDLERLAADADPLARYAAFVHDLMERYGHSEALRTGDMSTWMLFRQERARLESEYPDAWAAGRELLKAAGISRT